MKRALAYCVVAAAVVYLAVCLAQGAYLRAAILAAVGVVSAWTAIVDWREGPRS